MRILVIVSTALLLAACAIGPSVGDIGDFQEASAREIGGGIDPDAIRIHDRRSVLFTSWWTAKTPKGEYYKCHWGEDRDAECKPAKR